jgi:hypothetical protein
LGRRTGARRQDGWLRYRRSLPPVACAEGKRLRVSEPDDQQLPRAKAVSWRCQQQRLSQFAPEQTGTPDTIKETPHPVVGFDERAVEGVRRGGTE